MNIYNRGLLVGMALGDGCIKRANSELVIQHSLKQIDYLDFKRKKLHSIFGGKEPKISIENHHLKSNNKSYTGYRISKANKYFKLLYKLLYPNRKKFISKRILNYLNPEGIAYWYMDDGGVSKTKIGDRVSSVECRLYTYCSEGEVNNIIEYFNGTFSIVAKKRLHKITNLWIIVFNTKESRKFEMLIKKYMIESMLYKLPGSYFPRVLGNSI